MAKDIDKRLKKLRESAQELSLERSLEAAAADRRMIRVYRASQALRHRHLEDRRPAVAAEYRTWAEAINTTIDALTGSRAWRWDDDFIGHPKGVDCNTSELVPLFEALDKVNAAVHRALRAGDIPLIPDKDLLLKVADEWRVSPKEVRESYERGVLDDLLFIKEAEHGVDLDVSPPAVPEPDTIARIATEADLSCEALTQYYEGDSVLDPAAIRGY
jgi:hypothetical protein